MFTTTTTITTTTTSTASPIEPSSFYTKFFNTNQQEPFSIPSTEDPFNQFKNFFTSPTIKSTTATIPKKNDFKFSTKKPNTASTTVSPAQSYEPTLSQRPTIDPFYYGLNFKKNNAAYPFYKTFTTTKNPEEITEFKFNHLQTTSSTVHPPLAHSIPAKTFTVTQSTPFISAILSSTISSDHTSSKAIVSSTRNPIFDVYLKRVSLTTKSPYDFGNLAEYFKTTSTIPTPTDRSLNLLSANSNPVALSENLQQK